MIYLTVNDTPSGVYKSQVIDVITELNQHLDQPIKLVALISLRNFSANKKKILDWYPNAVVKRMVPKLKNWKKNKAILSLIKGMRKDPVIARGVMAFSLANQINPQVVYDGRGGVKAELLEFPDMIPDKSVVESLIAAEKEAVLNSTFRIAVSNKLIEYWQDEFGYKGSDHLVIPCTLTTSKTKAEQFDKEDHDVPYIVYAGSTAGWQSFEKVKRYLEFWIEKQNAKVLFLSNESNEIAELIDKYPGQVERKWVPHEEVHKHLSWADYGILLRDENTTNYVASPVKFAEYLAAGLKVLISPNLGDYSALVEKENLGVIIDDNFIELPTVSEDEKFRLSKYAEENLTKQANQKHFQELVKTILSSTSINS